MGGTRNDDKVRNKKEKKKGGILSQWQVHHSVICKGLELLKNGDIGSDGLNRDLLDDKGMLNLINHYYLPFGGGGCEACL
ncbi:hypothetical protein ACFX2A_013669 [Malus domestica]